MEQPAAKQIDAIIRKSGGWRGAALAKLRATITAADPSIIETVKWKKPSKPEGVPVWERDGILCVADTLKSAVRLTFPKGARIKDPKHVFNTRMDSRTVRAVDYFEGDAINAAALKGIIREAVKLNTAKKKA